MAAIVSASEARPGTHLSRGTSTSAFSFQVCDITRAKKSQKKKRVRLSQRHELGFEFARDDIHFVKQPFTCSRDQADPCPCPCSRNLPPPQPCPSILI